MLHGDSWSCSVTRLPDCAAATGGNQALILMVENCSNVAADRSIQVMVFGWGIEDSSCWMCVGCEQDIGTHYSARLLDRLLQDDAIELSAGQERIQRVLSFGTMFCEATLDEYCDTSASLK